MHTYPCNKFWPIYLPHNHNSNMMRLSHAPYTHIIVYQCVHNDGAYHPFILLLTPTFIGNAAETVAETDLGSCTCFHWSSCLMLASTEQACMHTRVCLAARLCSLCSLCVVSWMHHHSESAYVQTLCMCLLISTTRTAHTTTCAKSTAHGCCWVLLMPQLYCTMPGLKQQMSEASQRLNPPASPKHSMCKRFQAFIHPLLAATLRLGRWACWCTPLG